MQLFYFIFFTLLASGCAGQSDIQEYTEEDFAFIFCEAQEQRMTPHFFRVIDMRTGETYYQWECVPIESDEPEEGDRQCKPNGGGIDHECVIDVGRG